MPTPKFKPGQSGNPLGRPKDKTPATLLRKAIAAYSGAKLPPNPDESCHSFHSKAATDSGEVCHPLEV